jgi:hypothetical protein
MQFMPNSPRPPRGTKWSFPEGIKGTLIVAQELQAITYELRATRNEGAFGV